MALEIKRYLCNKNKLPKTKPTPKPMKRIALLLSAVGLSLGLWAQDAATIAQTMKRATQYMMDVASYRGGFVWNYLPDYSRQWGEIEAKRTMMWLQEPSTPDVGELLIDAYHATGDPYYWQSAERVASAIMAAQLPCGGWNYMYNFEPEDSTRAWYNTIGRQAWRLEEFQHYYGNATFDDEVTMHSASLLLRMYLERHDTVYERPLNRAIDFVLQSQYANGGWPQRYPLKADHPFKGKADYTPFITLNDEVIPANIEFLLQCYSTLGRNDLIEPIRRAMDITARLQYHKPLAGWCDQYTPDDLQPAHARSYEPNGINTGTTAHLIGIMADYYRLTGDPKFLRGIPDAIKFIEDQKLSDSLLALCPSKPRMEGDIVVPRYISPETGKPMFVHRKGSNVKNGNYYYDQDVRNTILHYNSFAVINIPWLKKIYADALALNADSLRRNSPLLTGKVEPMPQYYFQAFNEEGNLSAFRRQRIPSAKELIATLNSEGYWPTRLSQMSNPYKPIPGTVPARSSDTRYMCTMVGDEYDTSPYPNDSVVGISTQTYIANMSRLISAYRKATATLSGLQPDRFNATIGGKKTTLLTLRNARGAEACITNYGARLVSLLEPDRNGRMEDVVLGYDNVMDYHTRGQNFGSTVGRYIGRIVGPTITIDGQTSRLNVGGDNVISHGGKPGFANRVWDVVSSDAHSATLRYVSPDGENGFPGELTATVTYTLRDDNALAIDFKATTTKPTVVNLSNHSFFNISGDPATTVLDQTLQIDSREIAAIDASKNVTGKFIKVKHTPFDFTKPHKIGERIDADNELLSTTRGYDHQFRLSHAGDLSRPAAILTDPKSGRRLTVFTTEPALQIYTANGLHDQLGKKGKVYNRRSAVCLETMHFADSPHHKQFPSTVLRPGQTYHTQTIFQFSTDAE